MACTRYISCDKRESLESLFKRLIVEQPDGTLAVRTCCEEATPPPVELALKLTFDDIANAALLIGGDASDVADWNTFFDLPTNGTPFTSVTVDGNEVSLFGGSGITLRSGLFVGDGTYVTSLLSIVDEADCVVACETIGNLSPFVDDGNIYNTALTTVDLPVCLTIGYACFSGCYSIITVNIQNLINIEDYCFDSNISLTTLNFPNATTVGQSFTNCMAVTTINLSSCTSLGTTTGDDNVFSGIIGNTITLTCPAALLTCNGGAPDGDLCFLNDNNTLTVNGAPLAGCP